jgi:ABC-type antimicrobial peptide transport system permease subunit
VLTAVFAGLALILGVVGMYGVVSYGVTQRRREFGIRLALGARASQVTGVVVREALALAAIALIVGITAALGLTRLLSGLLYEVSPRDPVTFAAVAFVVATVAVAGDDHPRCVTMLGYRGCRSPRTSQAPMRSHSARGKLNSTTSPTRRALTRA